MSAGLVAWLTTPVPLSGLQRLLLLIPLCLSVSLVYKTTRCARLADIPLATLAFDNVLRDLDLERGGSAHVGGVSAPRVVRCADEAHGGRPRRPSRAPIGPQSPGLHVPTVLPLGRRRGFWYPDRR